MRAWIKQLFSNDESQVSTLHVILLFMMGVCTLPMLVMCYLSIRSTEPFTATVQGMASFMKDFGVGIAAIHGGAGSIWFLKGRSQ